MKLKIIRVNKEILTQIWLLLSGFGIMFAVLSWGQESNIIAPSSELGWYKGFAAVISGWLLYKYVARKMN